MRAAAILATLFTLEQYKAGRCDTACGFLGYSGGELSPQGQCRCYREYDYEEVTARKRLQIPRKARHAEEKPEWKRILDD